jgi:glycine/D-amino acid oxidase-like deaminating enzyme
MRKPDNIITRDSVTLSPWQQTEPASPNNEPANFSGSVDTVIVGAGITGITTALMLQKTGHKCMILEAGNIGFGTTGGTSAHLNTFFDATYPEIESDFGEEAAEMVADSGKEAFSIIKSLVDQYQIDCDFEYKKGYLFSENEKETKQLKQVLESSEKAGIAVTESKINGVDVPFETAICFPEQGHFTL